MYQIFSLNEPSGEVGNYSTLEQVETAVRELKQHGDGRNFAIHEWFDSIRCWIPLKYDGWERPRCRRLYDVYAKYYLDADDPENCMEGEWQFVGTTYATSEEQAINNVRYRTAGNVSQYKPGFTSGHWENGYDWEGVPVM